MKIKIKMIGVERIGKGNEKKMMRKKIKRKVDKGRSIMREKIIGIKRGKKINKIEEIGGKKNGEDWIVNEVIGEKDEMRKED